MNDISVAFAKLAAIGKTVQSVLDDHHLPNTRRQVSAFSPKEVESHFNLAEANLQILQVQLGRLYGDFPSIDTIPSVEMGSGVAESSWYSREQMLELIRTINQILELRAHSELAIPDESYKEPRVFISHGRANDWHEVQAFIEKDVDLQTLELAQEPNQGRTVLQKLDQESSRCDFAVIVMTGDDTDSAGNVRARENVMHEIGYFQGKLGMKAVCLLHEEGTNIPSNIHGLVYVPFPKDTVRASFTLLQRELRSFYGL